ncbi:MAG TPA: SAM-dependent methyltransferase [Burkholderiaceae bacterium]|nr:SAM-dependent methyltransferase [Burkholderiaceae bacterium]
MRSGTLYLLPAPISTASLDAVLPPDVIKVARTIEHFLAEDAKATRAFLKQLSHPKSLRELSIVEIGHAPREEDAVQWLAPLSNGVDVAVVSEAGCPAIADPGAILAAAAHRNGWRVQPLVGPSSIVLALMASGLNGQRFRFVGYLPIAAAARVAAIHALESESKGETQIFIETPYRNVALFEALLQHCRPATRLAVAVDLTGAGQFVRQSTVEDWRRLPVAARPMLARQPAVFCLLA